LKIDLNKLESEDLMIGGFEKNGSSPRKHVKAEFDERLGNEINHKAQNKELRKLRRERELDKDIIDE
jgi:hypothetical protein